MASLTLFSSKCLCSYSINGKILSILNVLDTAIIFGKLLTFNLSRLNLISFSISIKFLIVL